MAGNGRPCQKLLLAAWVFALSLPGCGGSGNDPVPASISTPVGESPPSTDGQPLAVARATSHHSQSSVQQDASYPVVVMKTTMGEVRVRLNAEKAPVTVDNFLANYVWTEHYDQTIFHHIEQGKMIIGGGFTTDLQAKPIRTAIPNEAHNGMKNKRGTIAMARHPDYINSADCQFFVNLQDNPTFDHTGRETSEQYGYCVFGEVIQGMELLDAMGEVDVTDSEGFAKLPVQPIVVESIRVLQ